MTQRTASSEFGTLRGGYLNTLETQSPFPKWQNIPAGGFLTLLLALMPGQGAAGPDGAALFAENCSACHAENRLGGTGPTLIPETLGRMMGPSLEKVIAEGRPATQMAGFRDRLSPEEIAALAAYISTPLAEAPRGASGATALGWVQRIIGGLPQRAAERSGPFRVGALRRTRRTAEVHAALRPTYPHLGLFERPSPCLRTSRACRGCSCRP